MEKSPPNLAEYLDALRCPECCLDLSVEAAAVARLIRAAKDIDEMPIPMPTAAAYERWVDACVELRNAVKAVDVWEPANE
jgi:hypothetical protein